MRFLLSTGEAQLLDDHLVRHIESVENELIHTDKRELQAELAREVDLLRQIRERLADQIGREPTS